MIGTKLGLVSKLYASKKKGLKEAALRMAARQKNLRIFSFLSGLKFVFCALDTRRHVLYGSGHYGSQGLEMILVWLSTIALSFAQSGSTFIPVCETPEKIGAFLGPRLLDDKSLEGAKKLIHESPVGKKLDTAQLNSQISKLGLFVSSPYLRADTQAGDRINEICAIFGTGGVSYGVRRAIDDNQSVYSPDARNAAIRRAVETSDKQGFDELKLD